MDWINQAQDRDQWMVLMNKSMRLRGFHKLLGNSSVAERGLASQGGLGSLEVATEQSPLITPLIVIINRLRDTDKYTS
jgi:hypothetical protein